MISLKKSFIYKDLCYLMILWSVKLPGRVNVSHKDLLPKPEGYVEKPQAERKPRPPFNRTKKF
jgi:hypothetical protein